MPFYPTPDRDDGYDITDFYGVDPRLGTLGDFVEFVRTARDRGMRVIADLVVNHTSDQHPWFQARDRSSEARLVRLGRRAAGRRAAGRGRSPTRRTRLWEYDEEAGSTTCTSSTSTSPTSTSRTPRCATRSPGSWASGWSWGCPGSASTPCRSCWSTTTAPTPSTLPDPHDYLADLRAFLNRRNGEAVLLGEVNLPYTDTMAFFGARGVGDELTMCFDFIGMQAMYLCAGAAVGRPAGQGAAGTPAAAAGRRTGRRSCATTTS